MRCQGAIFATSCIIHPFYDPLIAKLIVHAENRHQAILKMQRALKQFYIKGIHTTIPFLPEILSDELFIQRKFDNTYLDA